jgi:hypothetical protein
MDHLTNREVGGNRGIFCCGTRSASSKALGDSVPTAAVQLSDNDVWATPSACQTLLICRRLLKSCGGD